MAYANTTQIGGTSPYVRLSITEHSRTDTTIKLSYLLSYTAPYPASTSVNKSYSIVIDGTTVASGSYDINGKTGTHNIRSGTVTINRGTSDRAITCSASFSFNLTWSGTAMGVKSCSLSYTIPKKTSYSVKYNANGGSGAPSSQTKWYGTALTLRTTVPTRSGYTFAGWGTSASDTTVDYDPGDSYTQNKSITLYAIWTSHTYTVKYDANGGSGAPSSQTKKHGVTLKLSTVEPTRANYVFVGWGKSPSATTRSFNPGDNYTQNASVTLYAIWELNYTKPRITNLSIVRCNSDGTPADEGNYAHITFNWACERDLVSIEIEWESSLNSGSYSKPGSGTSGKVDTIVGDGTLSPESTYTIRVIVTDTVGYMYAFGTLNGINFVIDFLSGGKGVAFGKPAELDNVLDIGFQTLLRGGIKHPVLEPETDLNTVLTPNTYIGANVSTYHYTNCPLTSGTFTLEVMGMGEDGQVKQRFTYCHKDAARALERIYYGSAWGEWVCVSDFDGQLLWSGSYYMSAAQTVNLTEPVSLQKTGIVLVFSRYSSGAAQNYHFQTFFVPKYQVATHAGCGHTFMLTTDGNFGLFAAKYLYINDTTIVGNDVNEASGTGDCGIKYTNNGFVLRYVIGV